MAEIPPTGSVVLLLEQLSDAQKGKTLLILGHWSVLGRLIMCVDEVILVATSSEKREHEEDHGGYLHAGSFTRAHSEPWSHIRSVESGRGNEGIPCAVR